MALPIIYRGAGENPTANYDFSDISDGTGTQEYILFTSSPLGTLTYHMGRRVLDPGYTDPTTVANHELRSVITSTGKTFELQAFTMPQIVKGTAFVNFTLSTTSSVGPNHTPTVTIYKNSTSIASTSGAFLISTSTNKTYNLSLTIPRTMFKRGDQLKVKIECVSTGGQVFVQHDPLERDVTGYTPTGAIGNHPAVTAATNTTKATAIIPYELNL